MKKIILLLLASFIIGVSVGQVPTGNSGINAREDSIRRAKMTKDSIKMANLFAIAQYPYIKGSKWSGVLPVNNLTEVPDPRHEYRLLFELTASNPDSLKKEISIGLDEVARILNLHFAAGIPEKKIIPVVVIHAGALNILRNNDSYQKKFRVDNPNLKLIDDLENAGAKFIVCGQSLHLLDIKREEMIPSIKVSLTAQTVLSDYESKGYILYLIRNVK